MSRKGRFSLEMDIEEIKRLLKKLSKHELEKIIKNLQRITFNFKLNKSFFKYSSHPITIPKEFYPFFDFHGIAKKQEGTIVFPDGSIAAGYIHNSVSSWGEYYQIRIRNPYSGIAISKFKVGDTITVEIYRDADKTRIELFNLNNVYSGV